MRRKSLTRIAATAVLATTTAASTIPVYAEDGDHTVSIAEGTLAAAKVRLTKATQDLELAKSSLEKNEKNVSTAKATLDKATEEYNVTKKEYDNALANTDAEAEAIAKAEQEVAEKENAVDLAKSVFDAAMNEYDNSANEYNQAVLSYDDANKAYEEAKKTYETALSNQNEASNQVTEAEKALNDAETAVTEAENKVADATAKKNNYVNENTGVEEKLSIAENKLEGEKTTLSNQQKEQEEKHDALDNANEEVLTADKEVQEKFVEKEAAEADLQNAQNTEATANQNVADKQAIVDGLDKNSDEYKAREQAVADATTELNNAKAEKETADEAVTKAQAAVDEAAKEETKKREELAVAYKKVAEKEAEIKAKKQDLAEAQATKVGYDEAKTALQNAKKDYQTAVDEKDAAEQESKKASEAVTQAETELKTAQEKYNEALSNEAFSTIGFYKSLNRPEGELALNIIEYYNNNYDRGNSNANNTAGKSDPNNLNDATRLDMVLYSLNYIETCNQIRKENGLNELRISIALMAQAEAMANMESLVRTHWMDKNDPSFFWSAGGQFKYQNVAENAAFGYDVTSTDYSELSNAFNGWYTSEKKVYDYCKDVLGWEPSEITQNRLQALSEEEMRQIAIGTGLGNEKTSLAALKNICQVGHYQSVINPNYNMTGFGIRKDNADWPDIGTFTQRFAKDLTTNDGASYYTYTVDEYRSIILDYKGKVEQTIADAKAALEAAENALKIAQENKLLSEQDVELKTNVLNEAKKNLEKAESNALDKIGATSSTDADAEALLDNAINIAQSQIESIQTELAGMNTDAEMEAAKVAQTELEKANTKVAELSEELETKKTTAAEKKGDVEKAETDLKDANDRLAELNVSLETASANLDQAKAELETAKQAVSEAKKISGEKSKAYEDAMVVYDTKNTALTQALADYNAVTAKISETTDKVSALETEIVGYKQILGNIESLTTELANAENDLSIAKQVYDDAVKAVDDAKVIRDEAVSATEDALKALDSATKDRNEAIDAVNEAKAMMDAALKVSNTAEAEYEAKKADLAEAKENVPTPTDLKALEEKVQLAETAKTEADKKYRNAQVLRTFSAEKLEQAKTEYNEAVKNYASLEEQIVLNPELKVSEDIKATLPSSLVEELSETRKKINVTVPESSINFEKLVGTTSTDIIYDVTLDVELLGADMTAGKKKIKYDVSPIITFTTTDYDAVLGTDELNNYLTKDANITVELPLNGLDVKEIVHEDGDSVEYIYDFVKTKNNTIKFTVKHFSSFTLNEVPENPDYGKTENGNSQETGKKPVTDTSIEKAETGINYAGLTAGFIATVSLVGYTVLRRKCRVIG